MRREEPIEVLCGELADVRVLREGWGRATLRDGSVITGTVLGLHVGDAVEARVTDLDFASLTPGLVPEAEPVPVVDPWLSRRLLGFGCSELAALFVALGLRAVDGLPKYAADDARLLFSRKVSGRQKKAGAAAAGGSAAERDLLRRWVDDGCPGSDVEPWTVRHSDEAPREWYPLVDRYEPRLLCTPDAWGFTPTGALVAVEIKTSWERRYARPWSHALQVQGEMAVMGAAHGLVIAGPGWANERNPRDAIEVWPIERDEALAAEIRGACRDGWQRVEAMRNAD